MISSEYNGGMEGLKESLAELAKNLLAREVFGIETTSAAQGSDEPLTMERLLQFGELLKPRFYFEPVEIEPRDPFETIMLPYHRMTPMFDHRAVLYGTVAMPGDPPKRVMTARELYKSQQQCKRLARRIWALKVAEVLLRVIEKKLKR